MELIDARERQRRLAALWGIQEQAERAPLIPRSVSDPEPFNSQDAQFEAVRERIRDPLAIDKARRRVVEAPAVAGRKAPSQTTTQRRAASDRGSLEYLMAEYDRGRFGKPTYGYGALSAEEQRARDAYKRQALGEVQRGQHNPATAARRSRIGAVDARLREERETYVEPLRALIEPYTVMGQVSRALPPTGEEGLAEGARGLARGASAVLGNISPTDLIYNALAPSDLIEGPLRMGNTIATGEDGSRSGALGELLGMLGGGIAGGVALSRLGRKAPGAEWVPGAPENAIPALEPGARSLGRGRESIDGAEVMDVDPPSPGPWPALGMGIIDMDGLWRDTPELPGGPAALPGGAPPVQTGGPKPLPGPRPRQTPKTGQAGRSKGANGKPASGTRPRRGSPEVSPTIMAALSEDGPLPENLERLAMKLHASDVRPEVLDDLGREIVTTEMRALSESDRARVQARRKALAQPEPQVPMFREGARPRGDERVASEAAAEGGGGPVVLYESDATGASGKAYGMRYELRELDDVTASTGDDFQPNPGYPAELQPRDRSRLADKVKVRQLANALAPSRLLRDTETLDRGAPIIGDDGMVESGNGRVMALRIARAEMPQQWESYQAELRQRHPEAAGMRNPVLVRVRTTALTPEDRVNFVREANQGEAASMSDVELARADARTLTESFWQGLDTAAGETFEDVLRRGVNTTVVARFIKSLPEQEVNSFVTREGGLSARGVHRIKMAGLLDLLGEDNGMRFAEMAFESNEVSNRLLGGLLRAMPDLLKAKSPELGTLLTEALEEFQRFRNSGSALDEWVDQLRFNPVDPEAMELFKKLAPAAGKGGSIVQVADVFGEVVGKAQRIAQERAGQKSMFDYEDVNEGAAAPKADAPEPVKPKSEEWRETFRDLIRINAEAPRSFFAEGWKQLVEERARVASGHYDTLATGRKRAEQTLAKQEAAYEAMWNEYAEAAGADAAAQLRREIESAGAPAKAEAPKVVWRTEEPGVATQNPSSKPQGLYVDTSEARELGGGLGGESKAYNWHPRNTLDVSGAEQWGSSRLFGRSGAAFIEMSAGIKAAKRLLGDDEFGRLASMTTRERNEYLAARYPDTDWTRFHDGYEQIEALAGIEARKRGYDAILDHNEAIALSDSAITPKVGSNEPAAGGGGKEPEQSGATPKPAARPRSRRRGSVRVGADLGRAYRDAGESVRGAVKRAKDFVAEFKENDWTNIATLDPRRLAKKVGGVRGAAITTVLAASDELDVRSTQVHEALANSRRTRFGKATGRNKAMQEAAATLRDRVDRGETLSAAENGFLEDMEKLHGPIPDEAWGLGIGVQRDVSAKLLGTEVDVRPGGGSARGTMQGEIIEITKPPKPPKPRPAAGGIDVDPNPDVPAGPAPETQVVVRWADGTRQRGSLKSLQDMLDAGKSAADLSTARPAGTGDFLVRLHGGTWSTVAPGGSVWTKIRPIGKRFIPRVLKAGYVRDVLKKMKDDAFYTDYKREFVDRNVADGVFENDAHAGAYFDKMVENWRGGDSDVELWSGAANLRKGRTAQLAADAYEPDVFKAFEKYFRRVHRDMAVARATGSADPAVLDTISAAAGDNGYTKVLIERTLGLRDGPRGLAERFATGEGKAAAHVGLTGLTNPISQLQDLTVTYSRVGLKGAFRGALAVLDKDGKRMRARHLAAASEIAYSSDQAMLQGGSGWERWAPTTHILAVSAALDKGIKTLTMATALEDVQALLGKKGRTVAETERLARYGLTTGEIARFAADPSKLLDSPKALQRVAGHIRRDMTYSPSAKDLPLWMSSPVGSIAMRFKKPLYYGTRFLLDDMMSGLDKAFAKGVPAKERLGHLKPLVQALFVGGVAGEALGELRDFVTRRDKDRVLELLTKGRYGEAIYQWFGNIVEAGVLGAFRELGGREGTFRSEPNAWPVSAVKLWELTIGTAKRTRERGFGRAFEESLKITAPLTRRFDDYWNEFVR